jgi:hypothetical protein
MIINKMTILFSQLKNFIQNDPLSDWFEKIHKKYNCYEKDKESSFENELKEKKNQYKEDFVMFLKKYNYRFNINLDYDQTKIKLKEKMIGIFINCELYHKKYDILLKPDLIIHRNIFKEIFNEVNIDNLPEYIIFDIVYKTIHFNSDKTDILNDSNLYYYKCKLLLCNEIINSSHKTGYLFAKEYRHKEIRLKKKESIGYFLFTDDMKTKILEGLGWLDNLNHYYDNWIIYPEPTIKELYPNMNIKTGSWYNEKKKLAKEIKEITLVWNISYHKRCLLYDRGIKTWDDPILLNNIYPYEIHESKREMIQEKMIHMNKQRELKIQPRKIKKREFINHITDQQNSIILDIESVLNLDEKESYFTEEYNNENPKICIIGTIINQTNIFKDFTIKYLTEIEEKKIIKYWLLYLKKSLKTDTIKVYHWGNAEKVYLDYMKQKYNDLKFPQFIMIDLLSYFKNEPITIQGCFGYGLKEIVKQLYNHDLIKNQWIDDTDGLEAMVQFIKKSPLAESRNIPLKRYTEIKKIIYYNYMDCRVIIDILEMLNSMI